MNMVLDPKPSFGAARGRRRGPAHRAPAVRPRGPSRRALGIATTGLLVLAVAAFVLLGIAPRILGYQTLTMLTGSMSPLINPGDVVVAVPVPVASIRVGDIITYHIPVEDHRVETHRVTGVTRDAAGTTTVQTKGDANNGVDPWTATLEGSTAYKQVATVPYAGNVIRFLRQPVLMSILLYGAPAVLVTGVLITIWRKDAPAGPAER